VTSQVVRLGGLTVDHPTRGANGILANLTPAVTLVTPF